MSSILSQPRPDHLDFPNLELIQATLHGGERYSLSEYGTPWQRPSDVSLESLDMFAGEVQSPEGDGGVLGKDEFIPIERFSFQSDFISCVDLSKSAEGTASWSLPYIHSRSVLGDSEGILS